MSALNEAVIATEVEAAAPLRAALVSEHRKVVAEWSGNMAGHVAVREGWLDEPEDGWPEPEACDVCDLLLATPTGEPDRG